MALCVCGACDVVSRGARSFHDKPVKDNSCPCHVCNPKPPREPGKPFGTNTHGEWKQQSTYFVQYFEERWQSRIKRQRKRKADAEDIPWPPPD